MVNVDPGPRIDPAETFDGWNAFVERQATCAAISMEKLNFAAARAAIDHAEAAWHAAQAAEAGSLDDPLAAVEGVSVRVVNQLEGVGIYTLADLLAPVVARIQTVNGIGELTFDRLAIAAARRIVALADAGRSLGLWREDPQGRK